MIAWAMQRGISVIPKSVNPERIAQNFQAGELTLSEDEMNSIAQLDKGFRYISGDFWVKEGGPYTLDNLWG